MRIELQPWMYTQADPSGKQALLGKRPTVRGSLFAQNSQAVEPLTGSMIAIHGANPLTSTTLLRSVLSEKIISGLGTKLQQAKNRRGHRVPVFSTIVIRSEGIWNLLRMHIRAESPRIGIRIVQLGTIVESKRVISCYQRRYEYEKIFGNGCPWYSGHHGERAAE